MELYKRKYSEDWSIEIAKVETLLSEMEAPNDSVKITEAETVADFKAFADSHLSIVNANNGNPTFRPYLDRLIAVASNHR